MRTISKCLIIALGAAILLSCAGSKQKIYTGPGLDPSAEGAPAIIKKVTPDYPPEAMEQGITGTVWLKALVNRDGTVIDVIVLPDRGENVQVFEQSAKDAALKTKWKPATEDGKPIPVWVTYKVDFFFK